MRTRCVKAEANLDYGIGLCGIKLEFPVRELFERTSRHPNPDGNESSKQLALCTEMIWLGVVCIIASVTLQLLLTVPPHPTPAFIERGGQRVHAGAVGAKDT